MMLWISKKVFHAWMWIGRVLLGFPYVVNFAPDDKFMAVVHSYSLEVAQKIKANWDIQDRYEALQLELKRAQDERDAAFGQVHEMEKNIEEPK